MEKREPMMALIIIFTIAWLLVLVGTVLIFEVIVPFQYWGGMYDSIAKGVLTTILAVVWLYALVLLRNILVKSSLRQSTAA